MAYYDRWVADPTASSAELANRLNISPEDLQARLDRISEASRSGAHFTLGQATQFLASPEQLPSDLSAHLDACEYCQAMVDGLQPDHLRANIERLGKELKIAEEGSPVQPATAGFQGFQTALQRFAMPVAGFALAATIACVGLFLQLSSMHRSLLASRVASRVAMASEPVKFVYNTSMSDDERASLARDNFELSTRLLEAQRLVRASNDLSDDERARLHEILSSGYTPISRMANPVSVSMNGQSSAARSQEELELMFDRNKGSLFALYSRALRDNPSLAGDVVFTVTVSPSGQVIDCRVVSTTLKDPDLERALVARVKLFRFASKDVDTITFQKPVSFFPG